KALSPGHAPSRNHGRGRSHARHTPDKGCGLPTQARRVHFCALRMSQAFDIPLKKADATRWHAGLQSYRAFSGRTAPLAGPGGKKEPRAADGCAMLPVLKLPQANNGRAANGVIPPAKVEAGPKSVSVMDGRAVLLAWWRSPGCHGVSNRAETTADM